jgi:hypothetical protein
MYPPHNLEIAFYNSNGQIYLLYVFKKAGISVPCRTGT